VYDSNEPRMKYEDGKRVREGDRCVKAKSNCYKLSLFRSDVKTVSSFQVNESELLNRLPRTFECRHYYEI